MSGHPSVQPLLEGLKTSLHKLRETCGNDAEAAVRGDDDVVFGVYSVYLVQVCADVLAIVDLIQKARQEDTLLDAHLRAQGIVTRRKVVVK